ncbi:MAG: CbiX/SirB N-terminal domain-containing protein [Acidobacteriota bacterium]
MSKSALVLVGHGSHISPRTAGLVWRHVDTLREMGAAGEVTAAFVKEMPSLHWVLETLSAHDIAVVPLFTAQGYFTQTVIPSEMGLTGGMTRRDGRTIRYTPTLSEHPHLSEIVARRVREALRQSGAEPGQTAVALIGHGTRRNPESRAAAEAQAQTLRRKALVAEVVAVYLDDSPEVGEVYRLTSAPNLVAVPYFLALGSHTSEDVPKALSLPVLERLEQVKGAKVQGRMVYYTPPVGIEEDLVQAVLALAREAGAALVQSVPAPAGPASGSRWTCFPAQGRDELIAAVHEAGSLPFGQLLLTPTDVCPMSREKDAGEAQEITDPGVLRARVRENPFRPLATSTDLPSGWRVGVTEPEMLHAVVETVYPGAVADWAACRRGEFSASTLSDTVNRQTGMYRELLGLPLEAQRGAVEHICGSCVRHATWFYGRTNPARIPCGEPCNWWLSLTLDRVRA